jgi:murein DD-endopeptidase MepM/ murein hydrolase activator NlpD
MSALRPILLPLLAAAVVAVSAAAGAQAAASKVPRIVFPVVGKVAFSDDFGDARWQGGHAGNDILAERGAPVVAVEAGRIVFWTRSSSAGCMLYLYGKSGTTYQYIHLNNDLTAKNDNRGTCVPGVSFAPGLRDGQDVRAGELVGYVGDSGDADGIHPHLHFEIHPDGGAAVSPFRWLRRGERLPTAGAPTELQLGITPSVRPRPAD